MATFLHSRRFLSYHGERFTDQSLMIFNDDELCGVLPATDNDSEEIISHRGATYGGMVHNGKLGGTTMIDALSLVASHYQKIGYHSLLYKAVPHYYRCRPCEDDLYALHHLGARPSRCDLSSVVDLLGPQTMSQRRRRGINKAHRAGARLATGIDYAPAIWDLLENNLAERHHTKPTHSLPEIQKLASLFPDNVTFHLGLVDDVPMCGVVLFWSVQVCHAQYIASAAEGRKIGALDFLFGELMALASKRHMRYFSFGTSNDPNRGSLNPGLHKFKQEFGSSGGVHLFYRLSLSNI